MKEKMIHKVLSIAGFDGSGGAGIQADLKTFSALGCYGTTVLTALSVQNTLGIRSIYKLETTCIEEQLEVIFDDIQVEAVKIGMLQRQDIVESVTDMLCQYRATNIVLDPIMTAKSGDVLLLPDALVSMKKRLLPITTVLTPNLMEASQLLGYKVATKTQMEQAAIDLLKMGPQAVLVKGGHLNGDCDDCISTKETGCKIHWLSHPRIQSKNTHGTGCTLSAAIAAYLAKGTSILEAIKKAKDYLTQSIQTGKYLNVGRGNGSVHHLHVLNQKKIDKKEDGA